jgi:hypothetical protein
VNKMLVAALATLALAVANADDAPKAVPAPAPEARSGKAAGEKTEAAKPRPGPRAAETKGEAKPDKQKPCEPVKPCAID